MIFLITKKSRRTYFQLLLVLSYLILTRHTMTVITLIPVLLLFLDVTVSIGPGLRHSHGNCSYSVISRTRANFKENNNITQYDKALDSIDSTNSANTGTDLLDNKANKDHSGTSQGTTDSYTDENIQKEKQLTHDATPTSLSFTNLGQSDNLPDRITINEEDIGADTTDARRHQDPLTKGENSSRLSPVIGRRGDSEDTGREVNENSFKVGDSKRAYPGFGRNGTTREPVTMKPKLKRDNSDIILAIILIVSLAVCLPIIAVAIFTIRRNNILNISIINNSSIMDAEFGFPVTNAATARPI